MADEAAPKPSRTYVDQTINDKVIRWDDLSQTGNRVAVHNFKQAGRNLSSTVAAHIEKEKSAAADESRRPDLRAKSARNVRSGEAMQPHIVDKAITLESATANRVNVYHAGVDRANKSGKDVPDGAGWYFEHHRALRDSAKENGFATDNAINASAVLSPNNSPENEKASIQEIMKAHTSGVVHVTPEVAAHLQKEGIPVNPAHVGERVSVRDLHPHALAALSEAKFRHHVDTNVKLDQVGRGGPKLQIKAAIEVLHGRASLLDTLSPHSAPKVSSYADTIRTAVPDTPIHDEYMHRVKRDYHERTGRINPDQMTMDIHGLADSKEGLLSTSRHTAEDTWQNAITFNQPNVKAGRGNVLKGAASLQDTYPAIGKTMVNRVGKTISAHKDSRVGGSAVSHAYNNEATRRAAEVVSNDHTTIKNLPIVAMQEIPWTEIRRSVDKDPAYSAEQRGHAAKAKAHEPTTRVSAATPVLPGMNTPAFRKAVKGAANPNLSTQFDHAD